MFRLRALVALSLAFLLVLGAGAAQADAARLGRVSQVGVAGQNLTDGRLKLVWKAVPRARYQVRVADSRLPITSAAVVSAYSNGGMWTSRLSTTRVYNVQVRAILGGSKGAWSRAVAVRFRQAASAKTAVKKITPKPNLNPVARLDTTLSDAQVTFSGARSFDLDGAITSYAWSFGDGSGGTGRNLTHAYAAVGTYPVTLSVTDQRGAVGRISDTVTVTSAAVLARDTFTRSASGTWGRALTGGAWSLTGASRASVAGSAAQFSMPAAYSGTAVLPSVSTTNAQVTTEFSVDKVYAGSGEGAYVAAVGRSVGDNQYAGRIVIDSAGGVRLYLLRDFTALAPSVVLPDVTVTPGAHYFLSVQAAGSSPTRVAAKVWQAGTAEPSTWQTVADDSYSALQSPGTVGLFTYMPGTATNAPVTTSFHSFSAVAPTVVATLPTATPTPTPTAVPTPTPTAVPTPTPTATPTVPPTSSPASRSAGAAAVGSTTYTVPSNAIFATAAGSTGGSGTLASPYGSAQTAIDRAATGSTIVLRGGQYHESVFVPSNKALTIQSYPGEAVWFEGASQVTGWQQTGSTWTVSNWNYSFSSAVSFSAGQDETSWWTNSGHRMAGFPDQVWINGQELSQVGSAAAVTAGKFFVDKTNKLLIIGSDPTGNSVQASTLQQAIKIWGSGSVVRGIGVRHYATTVAQFGAVSVQVPNVTLENMVITDNATIGVYFWATGHVFRHLTVSDNGLLGVGGNQGSNFTMDSSRITGNNTERFNREPVSGGVKLTNASNVVISNNVIADNYTNGLWFDVSMHRVKVIGNLIKNNVSNGLEIELSEQFLVADNHVVGNGETGIWTFDSGNVDIWNNTLISNARSLSFWQDERRNTGSDGSTIPWVSRNIDVHNNLVVFGTNFCPILTQDLTNRWTGAQFGVTLNNNVYQRPSATNPSRWACWANGAAGIAAYDDMPSFVSASGMDRQSVGLVGATPVVDTQMSLTSSSRSSTASVATALPSSVASVIGQQTGVRSVGAFSAMLS